MMVTQREFTALIGELIEVLDREIALLELRLGQLERLCTCLATRDEETTGALLDEIEAAQVQQEQTDALLGRVREDLAVQLDRPGEKLRLSELVRCLPPAVSIAVEDRRSRLLELADLLKGKNMEAAVILSECAHLNFLLLQSLLPPASQVTTYHNAGRDTWRAGAGLVDARG